MALGNLRKPKQEDTPQAGLFRMPNTLIGNSVRQATAAQEAQTKLDNQNFSKMLAAQGKEDTIGRQIGYDAGSAFFRPIVNKLFPSDEMKLAQENETIQAGFSELLTDDMTQKQRLETIGGYLLKNNRAQEGMQFLQLASSIKDEGNAPLSAAGKVAYDLGKRKGDPDYKETIMAYVNKDQPKIQDIRGKAYGDRYNDTLQKSGEADIKLKKLDMMYELVNSPDFGKTTGFSKIFSEKYAPILAEFGISDYVDQATFNQSFSSVKEQLLADTLNLATGPQTDSDADRARKALAGLGNTQEANQFIVGFASGIAKAQIEKQEFIDDWLDENEGKGVDMKDAFKAYKTYEKSKPTAIDFYKPKGKAVPTFYWEFERNAIASNPNLTKENVATAWKAAKTKSFSK